jgi:GntR family transcriptional regulator/MocR family aminotransferase
MIDVFLDGVPIRGRSAALFDQLRAAIVEGRLRPGDQLPPSRDLATQLGVARSTIATVYARLVGEGYAEGRVGDVTFVTDYHTASDNRTRAQAGTHSVRIARRIAPWADTLPPPSGGWRIDLRTGRPDPSLFPVVDWRRCATAALGQPPPGYGEPAGLPELRHAIAAWVSRSRGVRATADAVLITAGAQGAFDLLARTLIAPGDTVAVEDPGYAPARHAFTQQGARIAAVAVDADGIDVTQIPRSTRAVIVTPSHQAPTGVVMSGARRRQLLALARARELMIIEDDYDTEYRYVERPLEPLHRLDTHGRVVYVGSFSKTLSPSLRLGFIVAPADLIAELTRVRHLVDTQPPHMTQATLAAFIGSGRFERHLRRTGRVYRSRRDHLIARLERLRRKGTVASFDHCPAGLHLTLQLPHGDQTARVADRMQAAGIAIMTTAEQHVSDRPLDLVIGFGLASIRQIDQALDALAKCAR